MTRKIFSFNGRCHLTGVYDDHYHDGKPFCLYQHTTEWCKDFDDPNYFSPKKHKKLLGRFQTDRELIAAAANLVILGTV